MRTNIPDETNVFFRCVEDSHEAIMISDREGKLTYVNPAWVSIYGHSKEYAVGRSPRILHSGVHDEAFYREMWRSIRDPGRGFWRGELFNRSKEGRLIPVLLTITPYRNREGEIEGYMGIALDMTRERELEERLGTQERLAAMGILASGLAHEIGTPLGVIRGHAELLVRNCSTLPGASGHAEAIVSQADRITHLIQSLLKLGRPGGSESVAVPIRAAIDEILGLLEQVFHDQGVAPKIEIAEDAVANADPVGFQQVLLNLLSNSVHAIEEEKTRGRARDHSITIRAERVGKVVRIHVEDTGCGISPENQAKIFEPFFTTKDVGKGTGMGLAIVSKIVAEMGGNVRVQSRPGNGAAFVVTLPAFEGVRGEIR